MNQEQQVNTSFREVVGRALLLPLRAIIYVLDPRNCCNSSTKIKGDMRNALKEVRDGRPRISLHARISPNSADLGIKILEVTSGAAVFYVPGYLSGNIYEESKINKLKNKVDKFKEKHPNIKFDLSRRTAIVEIDIEDIQQSSNGRKALTIKRVEKKICSDLKVLMKFIGGMKTPYHDMALVKSTAKILYDSHTPTEKKGQSLCTSSSFDQEGVVICIANKGAISGFEYQPKQDCNNKKAKKKRAPDQPKSSMSGIELNDLHVNQI